MFRTSSSEARLKIGFRKVHVLVTRLTKKPANTRKSPQRRLAKRRWRVDREREVGGLLMGGELAFANGKDGVGDIAFRAGNLALFELHDDSTAAELLDPLPAECLEELERRCEVDDACHAVRRRDRLHQR